MADVPVDRPWSHAAPQSPFGTPEEIAYENRAQETAIYIGGKLAIAIYGFMFASLAFAYFYLRSSNSEDLWRPNHMTAPTPAGAAIMAFSVAGGVAFWFGVTRFRRNLIGDWEVAGWVAVVMALAAVAIQCWQLASLPFFPGRSGYSSVFIAWAGMNIFLLLSVAYWSETLVARSARLRRARIEEGGNGGGLTAPLYRVNVGAASTFWLFAVIVSLLFWVFFYQL
jgi:heme/copper-type cytochrome/quinol oxidase subunit 3